MSKILTLTYLTLNFFKEINIEKGSQISEQLATNTRTKFKHFPSSVREWNNSIYVYNKNTLNLIPSTTVSAMKIIKIF